MFFVVFSASFQDPLEFQQHELRKYFVVGDHVRVVAGRHEGETGLIVRIETNLAVLLSDLTLHEVMILSNKLDLGKPHKFITLIGQFYNYYYIY